MTLLVGGLAAANTRSPSVLPEAVLPDHVARCVSQTLRAAVPPQFWMWQSTSRNSGAPLARTPSLGPFSIRHRSSRTMPPLAWTTGPDDVPPYAMRQSTRSTTPPVWQRRLFQSPGTPLLGPLPLVSPPTESSANDVTCDMLPGKLRSVPSTLMKSKAPHFRIAPGSIVSVAPAGTVTVPVVK